MMSPGNAVAAPWSAEQISCPLHATDSAGTIRELASRLATAPGVMDPAALLRDIEFREAESPTYLGGGVAMPHARTPAVNRLVVAVGISRNGVHWGSSRELARLIFLVGVPREQVRDYLDLVRRITQAVRRIEWIEQAVTCTDALSLAALLKASIKL